MLAGGPLGGGGGGAGRGVGQEGRRGAAGEGGSLGGGGMSGTSKQLGMRPRCDPTVRTTPSRKRGWGIIGLGIPSHTGNPKGVGPEAVMELELHHETIAWRKVRLTKQAQRGPDN